MDKKEVLAKIQRLSFAEKLAMLSTTDTSYLEDCIEEAGMKNGRNEERGIRSMEASSGKEHLTSAIKQEIAST